MPEQPTPPCFAPLQTEHEVIFRCESEWGDCSWSSRSYAEIDAHEALSGHFVTGARERVNPTEQERG